MQVYINKGFFTCFWVVYLSFLYLYCCKFSPCPKRERERHPKTSNNVILRMRIRGDSPIDVLESLFTTPSQSISRFQKTWDKDQVSAKMAR